jgi:hypothetical protein
MLRTETKIIEYLCCDRCGAGDFRGYAGPVETPLTGTSLDLCNDCLKIPAAKVQVAATPLSDWEDGMFTCIEPILEALGKGEFMDPAFIPEGADFKLSDASYQYLLQEGGRRRLWAATATREEVTEALFIIVRQAFRQWREYKVMWARNYHFNGNPFDQDQPTIEKHYSHGLGYWGEDFYAWLGDFSTNIQAKLTICLTAGLFAVTLYRGTRERV